MNYVAISWSSLVSRHLSLVVGALGVVMLLSAHAAAPSALPLPRETAAVMVRAPEKAAIISLARAGSRLVAVGERGVILLSDDEGRHWRQVPVPVSVTLTALTFVDETNGWAVGHGGVILHSSDGGQRWEKQSDGARLAEQALAAAERLLARGTPASEDFKKSAQRLVRDGADKPLLDVSFASPSRGVVVGAYGLAFETRDGGRTWESLMDRLDNPGGRHLNSVRIRAGTAVMVGEQGLVLRSTDDLQTWTALRSPYKGSFFAVALTSDGGVVVAGIKGNVFVSNSMGATWTKVELPVPVAVTALTADTNGGVLIANQAGNLYKWSRSAAAVERAYSTSLPMLASVIPTRDGAFVAGSLSGLARINVSEK